MADFTIVLKKVIEYTDGHIGLDDYPIFDEAYRPGLNKKIIDHFWNREIGVETIDMFLLVMKRKMNEVMPIYNQFYKSQLLVIDPLITFDTTTSTTNESTSTATNESTANSKARAVSSDTPQTQLSGNEDYASGITDNVGESVNTGEATNIDSSTGDVNTRGFSGAMSDLLLRYRETFLNIDMQVISELDECFMSVWNTNDEYFSHPDIYGWW